MSSLAVETSPDDSASGVAVQYDQVPAPNPEAQQQWASLRHLAHEELVTHCANNPVFRRGNIFAVEQTRAADDAQVTHTYNVGTGTYSFQTPDATVKLDSSNRMMFEGRGNPTVLLQAALRRLSTLSQQRQARSRTVSVVQQQTLSRIHIEEIAAD